MKPQENFRTADSKNTEPQESGGFAKLLKNKTAKVATGLAALMATLAPAGAAKATWNNGFGSGNTEGFDESLTTTTTTDRADKALADVGVPFSFDEPAPVYAEEAVITEGGNDGEIMSMSSPEYYAAKFGAGLPAGAQVVDVQTNGDNPRDYAPEAFVASSDPTEADLIATADTQKAVRHSLSDILGLNKGSVLGYKQQIASYNNNDEAPDSTDGVYENTTLNNSYGLDSNQAESITGISLNGLFGDKGVESSSLNAFSKTSVSKDVAGDFGLVGFKDGYRTANMPLWTTGKSEYPGLVNMGYAEDGSFGFNNFTSNLVETGHGIGYILGGVAVIGGAAAAGGGGGGGGESVAPACDPDTIDLPDSCTGGGGGGGF